jgi:hypothetical protein
MMSNPINDWFSAMFQDWSKGHPLTLWFLTHPIYLISLIVLGLILFAGLIGIIGRLSENMWLAILQLPVKLFQAIIQLLPNIAQQVLRSPTSSRNNNKEEQIQSTLKEIELLRKRETELLLKLQSLIQK